MYIYVNQHFIASLHGFVLACGMCQENCLWSGNTGWVLYNQELCHGLCLKAAGGFGRPHNSNLQYTPFSTKIVSQSLALPLCLGIEIGTSHATFIKLAPLMASWTWSNWPWLAHHEQWSFSWFEYGDPSLNPKHGLFKNASSHFWPELPQTFCFLSSNLVLSNIHNLS